MAPSRVSRIVMISLSLVWLAAAQTPSFHDEVLRVYSFQPRLLTDAQRAQKSAVLDGFWNQAKGDPASLPALRVELADFRNPPFFLYDGSMLLLTLSNTAEDRTVAAAAIAHSDLRDVQPTEYFLQAHRLAGLDCDVTAAALHILDQPRFQVFIAAHSLTLGQDYSLVYLLMAAEPGYWVQPAIERLKAEKDETAQKSLLLALWYAQTDAADEAIASFSEDAGRTAAARDYARELSARKGAGAAGGESEAEIRQRRRERMKAVSDEALIDLDRDTLALVAKRKP